MQTATQLEQEMVHINEEIQELGSMVLAALTEAATVLSTQDAQKGDALIQNDKIIDEKTLKIESLCTTLIARRNPVASNLRHIVSALKVSTELERIGDHAKYIVRDIQSISKDFLANILDTVIKMLHIGIHMIENSLQAFEEDDVAHAIESAKEDDKLDSLHKKLYKQILKCTKDSKTDQSIEEASTSFFINRFLERIGDHATNVCEWIYYAKTGDHIDLN